MITASVGIDLGRAAKLGGDYHEGAVEETSLFEIGEESGIGLVEDWELLVCFGEVIRVPVKASKLNFDETDAVLDETTREKDSFRELVGTIGGEGVVGFFGKIEGFEVLGLHQADSGAEHLVIGTNSTLTFLEFGGEIGVELGAESDLAVEGGLGDLSQHHRRAGGQRLVRRIRLQDGCFQYAR